MEAERIFLFLMPLPLPSSRICFLFKYMTRIKMQILLATPHFCAFHDLGCFSSFSSAPFEFLCLSFLSFFLHCLPKCKAPLYYPLHLNVEFSLSHLACMYTCMYNTALRKTAHAKQDGISSPDFSLLIFFWLATTRSIFVVVVYLFWLGAYSALCWDANVSPRVHITCNSLSCVWSW